ncbi:cytosolic sulfotransferase 12-like isoform X1 [Cornus florida]|uniref:cytosolic sulfotransferase 12-like isoform X1 n=1 Tax=Cornus florida TaxID=4283 RepID=UPI0028973C98|nr:cytosolic sulfotransferase 12-like isoform X1 [Cornus florida]
MATINPPKTTSTSALFDDLPTEKWINLANLYQWKGFWYRRPHLEAVMEARSSFKARDEDVILASSMKTGTTWLKALIPSIMDPNARIVGETNSDDNSDPLVQNFPNVLIPSFEIQIFAENSTYNILDMPSPRLFRTHMPYAMLPDSIKTSGCKIVYITRDPKDTVLSLWHFMNSIRKPEERPFPLNEFFESFCKGLHPFGPFHDHVLGYWKESMMRPEKILFLRYEDMKRDTSGQVKKLASFLGRPFAKEEEVAKVVWMCSFERLKNLEVNKNGVEPDAGFPKSAYFRLGVVGDWKNSLSMEMKKQLDEITCNKLEGSGLDLLN